MVKLDCTVCYKRIKLWTLDVTRYTLDINGEFANRADAEHYVKKLRRKMNTVYIIYTITEEA